MTETNTILQSNNPSIKKLNIYITEKKGKKKKHSMVQDFRAIVLVPVTLFVTSWESQTPTEVTWEPWK